MDTFTFPHLPAEKSTAYFALFRNVENAAALRQRIIKVSTLTSTCERHEEEKDAVNFAFIDARLITESFKNFGLSDKSTSLLVVRIGSPKAPAAPDLSPEQKQMQVQELMKDAVIGSIVPLDDPKEGLTSIIDWAAIRKLFKLNTEPAVKKASSPDEEHAVVDRIVTSAVAMKSVMQ
ncbi:hypothetical protein NMY22_g19572 [Coprinellus aureogranulatus]|nr:hypothetical protein NMY22_g19572 [Coprinellus aureogranulatus]